jgi:hypothetical protein
MAVVKWRTITEAAAAGARSGWVQTSDDRNTYAVKSITPISFICGQEIVSAADYKNQKILAAAAKYRVKRGNTEDA